MKPDKETCLVLLKDKNKNKETNLFQKPKQAEGYIKNNWEFKEKELKETMNYKE